MRLWSDTWGKLVLCGSVHLVGGYVDVWGILPGGYQVEVCDCLAEAWRGWGEVTIGVSWIVTAGFLALSHLSYRLALGTFPVWLPSSRDTLKGRRKDDTGETFTGLR
jgi:hypothetical protein